jgi:hypothetical protein
LRLLSVNRRRSKINFGAEMILIRPHSSTAPLRWIFGNLDYPPMAHDIHLRYRACVATWRLRAFDFSSSRRPSLGARESTSPLREAVVARASSPAVPPAHEKAGGGLRPPPAEGF